MGVLKNSLIYYDTIGLFYKPQIIDDGDCGAIGGMKICRGNRSTLEKTCPSVTLSTTNPTLSDFWLEPGPPQREVSD
jgi:hypothetical protein